jgi:hypothetical protein
LQGIPRVVVARRGGRLDELIEQMVAHTNEEQLKQATESEAAVQ